MSLVPPLDPGFRSEADFAARYRKRVALSGRGEPLVLGLEREEGRFSRFETLVDPCDPDTPRYAERWAKFLLWSRGGWRLVLGGPTAVVQPLAAAFRSGGRRQFDAELMERAYRRPFSVVTGGPGIVPAAREAAAPLGGHLDGCRLGFDLGASDFKIAAVRDGDVVFSQEFPWNPRVEPDPRYHWDHLCSGLRAAAAALPRVDAIGGSSAGVIVENEIRVASLFRAVSPDDFDAQVRGMFGRLQREFGVPVVVANDGEVTALAGAMALGVTGLLGIAMGSSEASGYIDRAGRLTGWLNELAFAPVDANPSAAPDEWSGDRGVGALYFSQQAVNRLLPASGVPFHVALGLPERLKQVQERMEAGDSGAVAIFESIGVYLAHAIDWYSGFYDFEHLLVLGRVTSGAGGERLVETARRVLDLEFPERAARVTIHVPDERTRRVGQAVAAASLPRIPR